MMNKKLIALLAALVLMMTAALAAAEPITLSCINDVFDVTLDAPSMTGLEYEAGSEKIGLTDLLRVHVTGPEGIAPLHLSIAFSDNADGLSLGDLGEEGIEAMKIIVAEDYTDPIFTVETTPAGNTYLMICNDEHPEIASVLTIYKGYFIEMNQHHEDFHEMTDADNAFAAEVFQGLWIVEHEQ